MGSPHLQLWTRIGTMNQRSRLGVRLGLGWRGFREGREKVLRLPSFRRLSSTLSRLFLSPILIFFYGTFLSLAAIHPSADFVTIGLLLPPEQSEAISLRQGAMLGLDHANQAAGTPARLSFRGRPGQWGTEGDEAAALALDEEVMAIITPSSGTASHQILQVSGRTRVPVVSLCPDNSVTRTGIPWAVRIVPRAEEEALAIFLGTTNGPGKPLRWTAFVPPDRAGREATHDLQAAARTAGCRLDSPVQAPARPNDQTPELGSLLKAQPPAILLWLDPAPAGQLAQWLRKAGFKGLLAGPGRLRSATFLATAGQAAEGVIIPTILPAQAPDLARQFTQDYQRRFAVEPDFTAMMAYDAVLLLADVLRQPGGQSHRAFPLQESVAGASEIGRAHV
jgi:ABC-type branched-subunit amino acid transport system substrate-binding protein